MSLMNGARLAIAAQAVGIAEAAYREAYSYATDRVQFKKAIKEFPPVYEMLTDICEIKLGNNKCKNITIVLNFYFIFQ